MSSVLVSTLGTPMPTSRARARVDQCSAFLLEVEADEALHRALVAPSPGQRRCSPAARRSRGRRGWKAHRRPRRNCSSTTSARRHRAGDTSSHPRRRSTGVVERRWVGGVCGTMADNYIILRAIPASPWERAGATSTRVGERLKGGDTVLLPTKPRRFSAVIETPLSAPRVETSTRPGGRSSDGCTSFAPWSHARDLH